MEDATNFLSALPQDSLFTVVSFLDFRDTLRLSELNSSIQATLSLSTQHNPNYTLIDRETWFGSRDEESNTPRRSHWIPVLIPHRTHSIVLTCTWRDQAFGNRKGALYIVAVPIEDAFDAETLESIENGKIVYESPLAPHEEESLRISFSYSPSKAYYLWYRVGGGGGHQLRVMNLRMHTIIHDTPDKWIGRNYQALQRTMRVLHHATSNFSLQMLRLIATMAQQDNSQASTALLDAFFEVNGFDTTQASVKALQELADAMLELDRQNKTYAGLPEHRPRGGVGRVPLHRMNENVIFNGRPAVMQVMVDGQVQDLNGPQGEGLQALHDVAADAERLARRQAMLEELAPMMANNVVRLHEIRAQQERAAEAAAAPLELPPPLQALVPAAMDEDSDDDDAPMLVHNGVRIHDIRAHQERVAAAAAALLDEDNDDDDAPMMANNVVRIHDIRAHQERVAEAAAALLELPPPLQAQGPAAMDEDDDDDEQNDG